MKPKTLAIAALTTFAALAVAAAFVPSTCLASTSRIIGLSRASAKPGATLTVIGTGFGSSASDSTVTFGGRPNAGGFAPVSKKARVLSWSNSRVKVRVPGMAPGSHPVYVRVNGSCTNSYGFSIAPSKVISGKTFTSSGSRGVELGAMHGVLYDNCTFEATDKNINGTTAGVLTLGQNGNFYDNTFRDCTIKGNTGPGSGSGDYGVNGIKLVDISPGGQTHDVTFDGCTIDTVSRMAFEAVEASRPGMTNIALLGCTFEPAQNGEAISWDFVRNQVVGDATYNHKCLVANCLIKGFDDKANAQYGGAIESSGGGLEVLHTTIWAGDGPAFNIEGVGNGVHSMLLFDHVTVDYRHLYQQHSTGSTRLFGMDSVSYAKFIHCAFNTGNSANHAYNAGDGRWLDCTHNDMHTSTIGGYCGSVNGVPKTAAGYFDSGVVPSSNENNLPRKD